jgi:hypothetical protein
LENDCASVIDCEISGDEEESRSGLEEESERHFVTYVAPYVGHFLCCADAGRPEETEFANDAWVDQVPLIWGLRCAERSWLLQCKHNNDSHNDARCTRGRSRCSEICFTCVLYVVCQYSVP